MNRISEARWLEVLTFCGVAARTALEWAPIFERHVQPERFSQGAREIDDFVGQILHETVRLEHLEESLHYSAKRLTHVWPGRFPTLEEAEPYAMNPEALAERCYGGRMGNNEPGDGYLYRGRGIPMVTGKDNYALLEQLLGLPLVAYPDLLCDPDTALRCGVAWWEKRVPDSAIDSLSRVTRAVQGAQLGLEDRGRLTDKAKRALA
jgi:putative chitinase